MNNKFGSSKGPYPPYLLKPKFLAPRPFPDQSPALPSPPIIHLPWDHGSDATCWVGRVPCPAWDQMEMQVPKWVEKLEEWEVLKPVKDHGSAKCYALQIDRYTELFERESDFSFMSIESPPMSIQTTSLSIESTPDVDSNAINRIEKEDLKKKGIIDDEHSFFTNSFSSSKPQTKIISISKSDTASNSAESDATSETHQYPKSQLQLNRTVPIHSFEFIEESVALLGLDEPTELFESEDFSDDSTDTWDACQLEKKCLKLSYFFNYLEEIVTKNDFFGLPTVTKYVTDIQHAPKPILVKKAA